MAKIFNYRIENARGEIVFYPWENHYRLHIRPVNAPTQYHAFPNGDPRIDTIMDALGIG